MDPQLIEKITRLVIAKLEQEPKKVTPLSVQEIEEWERISATFQMGKVSPRKKQSGVGLSNTEIDKWEQVTAMIQGNEKKANRNVVKFHPYH